MTVLKQVDDYVSPSGKHAAQWLCLCDCGNQTIVLGSSLVKNNGTKSCGCLIQESAQKVIQSLHHRMDLLGQDFGRLKVIERADDYITSSGKSYSQWVCQCQCGNTIVVKQSKLIQGKTKSCGCLRSELTSNRRSANLLGMRFGRLTVIKRMGSIKDIHGNNKSSAWYCKCDCGGHKIVRASSLINGDCLSCGCIVSHGEDKIRKYLEDNNILFKSQYWFDNLRGKKNRPLYFDFAIFGDGGDLKCLIEYQGIQHFQECEFKDFGKLQREVTDTMKQKYCNQNQILLFDIKYDENVEDSLYKIIKQIEI